MPQTSRVSRERLVQGCNQHRLESAVHARVVTAMASCRLCDYDGWDDDFRALFEQLADCGTKATFLFGDGREGA